MWRPSISLQQVPPKNTTPAVFLTLPALSPQLIPWRHVKFLDLFGRGTVYSPYLVFAVCPCFRLRHLRGLPPRSCQQQRWGLVPPRAPCPSLLAAPNLPGSQGTAKLSVKPICRVSTGVFLSNVHTAKLKWLISWWKWKNSLHVLLVHWAEALSYSVQLLIWAARVTSREITLWFRVKP